MRQRLESFNRFTVITLVTFGVLFACTKLSAAADSPWFLSGPPEFATLKSSVSDAEYPATHAQKGNIDCDQLTFTKRTGDLLPFLPLHQEVPTTGCYIASSSGALDPNGFMHVNGTTYAADVVKSDNTPTSFLAFPGSDIFISNASNSPANGAYVWFSSIKSALKLENDNFGRIRAKLLPSLPQTALADKAGNKLAVMADNFGVSENGQWAVVDSPGRALLRINLASFEVLSFAPSMEYGNGIGAALRMHISGDGRFAVIASKNYDHFKLYDLSTCSPTPSVISGPTTCTARDLSAFIKTRIPNFTSILQLRFQTDNLLRVYASRAENSTSVIGQYALAAPGTPLKGMNYLALGDSFSSGEGAHDYEVGTDERGFNMCHLSVHSYPYVIAQKLQVTSFHSVACSGATSYNVIGGNGISKDPRETRRDNQYNDPPINDSLGIWLPGYTKQVQYVSENQPELITLSVIGNDLGFDDLIKKCIAPKTCYPTYEDRLEEFKKVDSRLTTLTTLYKKLKKSAPANARIYAVGYPQIALPGGSCGLNVHLDSEELVFASELITRINQVVKTAAGKAGILYGDVEQALSGYRLCEATLGNHAVNGLTAGDDILHIIGNESYHPTSFGQFLMAQALLGATNNFSEDTAPSAPLPDLNNNPALIKAPKTNRTINKKEQLPLSKQVAKKGTKITAKISGLHSGLATNTPLQILIDNQPVGTITTDQNGDVEVEITLPEDLENGMHDIDVVGPDAGGNPTDFNSPLLVTPGEQPACSSLVTPSGIDSDSDGTDDACDALIGLPPAFATSPNPPATSSTASTTQVSNTVTPSPTEPSHHEATALTNTSLSYETPSPYASYSANEIVSNVENLVEAHSPAARVALKGKEAFLTQYKRRPVVIIVALGLLGLSVLYLLLRPRPENTEGEIYIAPTRHYFRI